MKFTMQSSHIDSGAYIHSKTSHFRPQPNPIGPRFGRLQGGKISTLLRTGCPWIPLFFPSKFPFTKSHSRVEGGREGVRCYGREICPWGRELREGGDCFFDIWNFYAPLFTRQSLTTDAKSGLIVNFTEQLTVTWLEGWYSVQGSWWRGKETCEKVWTIKYQNNLYQPLLLKEVIIVNGYIVVLKVLLLGGYNTA